MSAVCTTCGEVPHQSDPVLSNGVCVYCGYWGIPKGPERAAMRARREGMKPLPVLPGSILWAVWGKQGSYSEHTWWVVAVYLKKELAEEHARRLNEWCAKRSAAEYEEFLSREHPLHHSPLDPHDAADYTYFSRDREYGVEPFKLHHSVDTFPEEHAVLTDKLRELGEIP